MSKLNVVELYAGSGRSSEPFRRWRAASLAALVDSSRHARDSYLNNHPRAQYIVRDVSAMSANDVRSLADGKVDILLGCPPCQGFSESGKRARDDPRNDHIVHFARLAAETRPLVVAMENVPLAGVSMQFAVALRRLETAGYRWTAAVLNAARYGSAQSRHRLVMVAVRADLKREPELPTPTHAPTGEYFDYSLGRIRRFKTADEELLGLTSSARRAAQALRVSYFDEGIALRTPRIGRVLAGLPRVGSSRAERLSHASWAHSRDTLRAMRAIPEGGQRNSDAAYFAAAYGRLHRRGLARTLTTFFPNAGGGRFWHPTENRALTVREAARIQGFSDDFHFLGGATQANAILVGNALDSALAEATFRAVRRLLE